MGWPLDMKQGPTPRQQTHFPQGDVPVLGYTPGRI